MLSHQRQVVGTVDLPVAQAVLSHGHAQDPVEGVFHSPMRPHRLEEPLRIKPFAEKEDTGLGAPFPLDLPCRGDLPDGLQAGPVMQVHQRVDVVSDGGLADLDAPVTVVHVIESSFPRSPDPPCGARHRREASPGCP